MNLIFILILTYTFVSSNNISANENIENYQVLVDKKKENLIFTHRIEKGGSSKSYGIEAAKLAGVPRKVIEHARAVLNSLEKTNKKNSKITIN